MSECHCSPRQSNYMERKRKIIFVNFYVGGSEPRGGGGCWCVVPTYENNHKKILCLCGGGVGWGGGGHPLRNIWP